MLDGVEILFVSVVNGSLVEDLIEAHDVLLLCGAVGIVIEAKGGIAVVTVASNLFLLRVLEVEGVLGLCPRHAATATKPLGLIEVTAHELNRPQEVRRFDVGDEEPGIDSAVYKSGRDFNETLLDR